MIMGIAHSNVNNCVSNLLSKCSVSKPYSVEKPYRILGNDQSCVCLSGLSGERVHPAFNPVM
jgi:hypothetical protein